MGQLDLEQTVGPAAKPLKLGVAAFVIGCCGVLIGFVIDYGPHNPVSFIVFCVVALSVLTGFFALAWTWLVLARSAKNRRSKEGGHDYADGG